MATWQEVSLECLKSAKLLMDHGCYRRSVSSAYYAVYSIVTHRLVAQNASFARGWNNPAHDQISHLVLYTLALPISTRRRLNRTVHALRQSREDADYRPGRTIGRQQALECIHLASDALKLLEGAEEWS